MVDTARTGERPCAMPPCSRRSPFAAERLLLAADWREAADEVLERMGRAAGVVARPS